ncbi:MAG: DUF1080 domain-containing protein [Cyclobacteriaceae bacterium]|nr:DUF1080 domain-containing protein [Cyclobacteriaceae bacterium]
MKKFIATMTLAYAISGLAFAQGHNTLTDQEKKEGWQLLFDGKTTKGWHTFNKKTIGDEWKVTNGELWLDPKPGALDIATDKEYENFELLIEWKIDSCGNSGIFINAVESPKYEFGYYTGPEMQVLHNECHPDGKIPKHRAGNLYDLIASSTESARGPREWNQVRILVNKGHLEFWLNGVKQVETTMFTPEWEAMIKDSKFKKYPDFGKARKGRIMLQEHGSRVWYRNIKIREL